MFELVLIAALSRTIVTPAPVPDFSTETVTMAARAIGDDAIAPPAFVDPTMITWRASVAAASAADREPGAGNHYAIRANRRHTPDAASHDSPPVDGSYDAMLAKRWHWFELYGVSRLHVVPRESRHPWWFSY